MRGLFRLWLFLCTLGMMLSIYQGMASIVSHEHDVDMNFHALMTEAQKRGGVFPDMEERLKERLGLSESELIEMDIRFMPEVGISVQKRQMMTFSWRPVHKLQLFAGGEVVYHGERRTLNGVSHLYRKE